MTLIAKDESLENIQITTTYTTSDGRKFEEEAPAAAHQALLDAIALFCESTAHRTDRGCARVRNVVLAWEQWKGDGFFDEDASERLTPAEWAQLEGAA